MLSEDGKFWIQSKINDPTAAPFFHIDNQWICCIQDGSTCGPHSCNYCPFHPGKLFWGIYLVQTEVIA
jgi:hypothetical protein